MDIALLERLTAEVAGLAGSVQFLWHGGEPLLAGRPFFETALALQARYPSTKFENFIQTNATLIDDDWALLLHDGAFRVRFSLDGPQVLHDRASVYIYGRGTFSTVCRAICRLREAGIDPQISCVITEQSAAYIDQIYSYLRDTGVSWISFLPAFLRDGDAVHESTLRPATFVEVYKRLFDLWSCDTSGIHIREIEGMIAGLMGRPSGDCTYTGACANIARVESSGEVFPCELHSDPESYGRIGHEPLLDILRRRFTGRVARLASLVQNDVQSCSWFRLCHGGCYAALTSSADGQKYYYCCEARGKVFEYITTKLKSMHIHSPLSSCRGI
jgi:serine-type anaerobic sulfatase-maturating enzyme